MYSCGVRPRKVFEPLREVVGGEEGCEVFFELVVAVVMVAPHGGLFQRAVHALDLAVIRYVIFGACCGRRDLFESGVMVSPSGTQGHREHEGAGRPADRQWASSSSSLHGRSLRLSRMRRERGSVDVVSPASSPNWRKGHEGEGMRIIGLDIHRVFAEAVAWEDGKLRRIGRVDIRRDLLEKFACSLSPEEHRCRRSHCAFKKAKAEWQAKQAALPDDSSQGRGRRQGAQHGIPISVVGERPFQAAGFEGVAS